MFRFRNLNSIKGEAFDRVKATLSLLHKNPILLSHSALYMECSEAGFCEAAPFWCALADVLETPPCANNPVRTRSGTKSTSSACILMQGSANRGSQPASNTASPEGNRSSSVASS